MTSKKELRAAWSAAKERAANAEAAKASGLKAGNTSASQALVKSLRDKVSVPKREAKINKSGIWMPRYKGDRK